MCDGELPRGIRACGLLPEPIAAADGRRAYNRADWEGGFGRDAPQRANRRAGEVVNEHGFVTNRAGGFRGGKNAPELRTDG